MMTEYDASMDVSQNGWPVVRDARLIDHDPIVGSVHVPGGMLAGDVATIFRWIAEIYNESVEPLKSGQCGGWVVRKIGSGNTWSNHASATAVDFNWQQNPDNTAPSKVMTPDQISACHAIVAACDGVVRWGGDYHSDPDPMHWEIIGSRVEAHTLANTLRREVKWMKFDVEMPIIGEGDRDDRLPGYNLIGRIQAIVGTDQRDGIWGPKTTDAISGWLNKPASECRKLTEVNARRIFGLANPQ